MTTLMTKIIMAALGVGLNAAAGKATVPLPLTLDEAIIIARRQSVDAAVARNELKTAYWEYRTFRADLLPEVNLQATLPSYRKEFSSYQLEDGSYTFVRTNNLQINGAISVDQNIWLTGGKLSLVTSLDFLKQLDGNSYNRFMSVPIALTLNQPIFGVNHIKWNRRIMPVRYEEAKAAFIRDTETVAMKTVDHFFSLLKLKENYKSAVQNRDNALKLFEVAKAKRRMGQISQNDLLQFELNLLNSRTTLADTESAYKSKMFEFRAFLGLDDNQNPEPILPDNVPDMEVTYGDVIEKALANNPFSHNIRRRQLEAEYEVAVAKGNQREISLFAQIGFTGTSDCFKGAYAPLKNNQVVHVGFNIPLIDWGKRRGKVKVAESNREVVESRLRQETMEFKQDIFMLVDRFNNQKELVGIAARADTIALKRYQTNVETFLVGKISTLELNDSQSKKDASRANYIVEMFLYWYYYYQLRGLTLWDFSAGRDIDADIEAIVR